MVRSRPRGAVAGALVIVLVMAGCGSSSSPRGALFDRLPATFSAASYIRSVCSGIAPFKNDLVARSSALSRSSASDVGTRKRAIQDLLTAAAQDADRAIAQLKSAGAPE